MTTEKVIETAKEVASNDKLQNAVAAMINKSLAAFDAGADFLAEQIPDVLHQLLLWHAVRSGVLFLLGVVLIIIWIVLEFKTFKYARAEAEETLDKSVLWVGWGVVGMMARIPLLLIVGSLVNLTWLQIWIAPKVWLIEYAAHLVGGK